jgi:iron(III) transport system permease protein
VLIVAVDDRRRAAARVGAPAQRRGQPDPQAAPKALPPLRSLAAHVVCYAIVLASSLPSLVVIYTSFRKTSGPVFKPGIGSTATRASSAKCRSVISNSATYALIAVALIVVLGRSSAISSRAAIEASPACSTAPVHPLHRARRVLGLAFVVTFNVKPLEITGTATIIVLMLFIRRLPYAVRSSASILKQIRGSIEEAAVSLGASPARAFRKITLPLMLPGIVAGALMSFITRSTSCRAR